MMSRAVALLFSVAMVVASGIVRADSYAAVPNPAVYSQTFGWTPTLTVVPLSGETSAAAFLRVYPNYIVSGSVAPDPLHPGYFIGDGSITYCTSNHAVCEIYPAKLNYQISNSCTTKPTREEPFFFKSTSLHATLCASVGGSSDSCIWNVNYGVLMELGTDDAALGVVGEMYEYATADSSNNLCEPTPSNSPGSDSPPPPSPPPQCTPPTVLVYTNPATGEYMCSENSPSNGGDAPAAASAAAAAQAAAAAATAAAYDAAHAMTLIAAQQAAAAASVALASAESALAAVQAAQTAPYVSGSSIADSLAAAQAAVSVATTQAAAAASSAASYGTGGSSDPCLLDPAATGCSGSGDGGGSSDPCLIDPTATGCSGSGGGSGSDPCLTDPTATGCSGSGGGALDVPCTTDPTQAKCSTSGTGSGSGVDICVEHPLSAGCQPFDNGSGPGAEGITAEMQRVVDVSAGAFDSIVFSGVGSCPAPRVLSLSTGNFVMSYQPLCDFLGIFRFVILAVAVFSGAVIILGERSNN